MKNTTYNSRRRLFLSAFLVMLVLVFSGFTSAYSQMRVTNGTTLRVQGASFLNSSDTVFLSSGGSLDVQGTLILKKNLVNQNASPDTLGTGTIVFSGAVNQSISGQNIIQNLQVNNPAGLTVAGNTKVNGVLTLTSGVVTLGAFNLLLGPLASVAGTFDATKMVVPTVTGQLQKEFPSAGGSFTFPVGDATGTAEYSPVSLAFNSGTFAANNYAGVTLVNAKYPGTAATSYLTRYWNVTQSGITGFSCNSTFQYVEADVVAPESDIFCFRVLPAPFTAYNATNTGTNQINAHGLASFGTFTGNLGDALGVPPAVRSLQDKIIASGMSDCADATTTLLIAGNGTTYLVQNGGSVNHIAGVNILYYPGTKVESGGYMHGTITSTGTFCNPYIHPAAQAPLVTGIENPGIGNPNNSFFKIYPNPTPGKFTLELKGDVTAGQVHVEIFGVLGDKILSKDMQIDRKQEFSLADKPVGVYMIHVTSGLNSETEKIIKR